MRILTPYVLAYPLAIGKLVLDVGCSSGYGSWLLMKKGAQRIFALDLDAAKVIQTSKFGASYQNLSTLVMDAQNLGFKEKNFEIATYFEIIEHVPRPDNLLAEIVRVLRRDGLLILTTPNRAVRLRPLQRPWNPDHLREYTFKALQRQLTNQFPTFEILGIYGEPKIHEFYRKRWRQGIFNTYFGWALSKMRFHIPTLLKKVVRNQLVQSNSNGSTDSEADLLNRAIPAPEPKLWPFYLSDVQKDCLNFVAVCGFDDQIVQRAVRLIKQSSCRSFQS
jgi:ubiquinone/menaquinone biosynthesis C-methylase UbiE